MSATPIGGKLMDAGQIVEELGVSRSVADKVIRWCALKHGVVRPEGIRKLYVFRADVDAWISENTKRSAA